MQTLENGVEVFTNGDEYNLADDMADAFNSVNVAVLVANQAARDALTKYDGLSVRRLDVTGRPTETWDGAAWTRSPIVTSAVATTVAGWSVTGGCIKTVIANLTQVTATLQLVRTGGDITVNVSDTTLMTGVIPAGFRPTANAFFSGTVNTDTGAYHSMPQLIVNTGGSVVGRSTSGGPVPVNTGYTLFISVSWYV